MATTLTALRARSASCSRRRRLANATLDGYIADAIRFYSLEFPRLYATPSPSPPAPSHTPCGRSRMLGVVSVEYPSGSPTRVYPRRRREHTAWQSGETTMPCAAWPIPRHRIGHAQANLLQSDRHTGQFAVITYRGLHRIPVAGDDDAQITVPESHWEASLPL